MAGKQENPGHISALMNSRSFGFYFKKACL